MTKHVITGSFALFYGEAATGNEWVPNNPSAGNPNWTVLVMNFGKSHVGKTSVDSATHLDDVDITGHKIALVANWKEDASGDFVVDSSRDQMICDNDLDGGVQNMMSKIFRGAAGSTVSSANKENVLAFLGAQAPSSVIELLPAGTTIAPAGHIHNLGTNATINIPGTGGGVITIPA